MSEVAVLFGAADPIVVPLWYWFAFGGFVITMLVLDLGVFHRHSRETTLREAGIWTIVWVSLALSFNAIVWWRWGSTKAVEFLTGYMVEWALSMDNVFVFAVIFGYFKVPMKYQYRVLFWGILGAVLMRLTFILAGSALISHFEWALAIMGGFLLYTGIHLAMQDEGSVDPEKSWILRLARWLLPVAREDHGERFFVRENGRRCITPLFLVLLVVESTDVAFAVDSVPAIFSITKDPFIVFTSNIFAVLGLRALYFLLAGFMGMFKYLKYGLSAILVFVGCKLLVEYFFHRKLEPWQSLIVIFGLLAVSIIASLLDSRRGHHEPTHTPPQDPALGNSPSENFDSENTDLEASPLDSESSDIDFS